MVRAIAQSIVSVGGRSERARGWQVDASFSGKLSFRRHVDKKGKIEEDPSVYE